MSFSVSPSILLLSVFSLTGACSTVPKPASSFAPADLSKRLRKAIDPQIGPEKNVGVIVGIYDQGKVQFLSFGEVERGSKKPPNETTIFEIGSITKTFTGLMLAHAIEEGLVNENDPISKFQSEWKNQNVSDITLEELVTHRSGLPRLPCNLHYTNPHLPYAEYTNEDLVQGLTNDSLSESLECSLQDHPSAEIEYSNWGFALLGYILGKKQGFTYPEMLDRQISKPLHLVDTTYALSSEQFKRTAVGYDSNGVETQLWDRQAMMGNGAVRSTAADLILYAKAFLHPDSTSLSAEIHRTIQVQPTDTEQKIAYAWFVTPGGSLWHNGMTGGFASLMKIYLKKDFAIFYLTNTAHELKCVVETVENIPCAPEK
jgi:CubicO group peptidase (beta-lactamase class C family)